MAVIRSFRGSSPKIGQRVFLAETAALIGDVELGDDVSIWYSAVLRGDCNRIRIGARTNVQDGAVVHVTGDSAPTLVEEEVTIGHGAVVHGCTIRRGALVGMGATLLDGAEVGEEAFVAAGALVAPGTKIPPRTMWMGAPARFRRELDDAGVASLREAFRSYLDYKAEYLAAAGRPEGNRG
jgi:carbonic anhydrase/acetyltransferase-like protein (isoleucine patch superfamily)